MEEPVLALGENAALPEADTTTALSLSLQLPLPLVLVPEEWLSRIEGPDELDWPLGVAREDEEVGVDVLGSARCHGYFVGIAIAMIPQMDVCRGEIWWVERLSVYMCVD